MVSGTTGRNDISTSSPVLSMLALCSTWWYFVVNKSVANKGCCNQIFCLVVLVRITSKALASVVAMHLFTIMPRGRLWYSACSTRHVTFNGILFLHPGTVMTEYPGMQKGFFFYATVTFPIQLIGLPKFCWSFLDRSSIFGGSIYSDLWDTVLKDTPNTLPSHAYDW